jgi:quinoprotein glucose dehydrogenase
LIALAQPSALSAQTGAAPSMVAAANSADAGAEWPAYGGTSHATRYSSLAQITATNVGQLQQVWDCRTEDMPNAAADGRYSPENTPIKVGDTMFVALQWGL